LFDFIVHPGDSGLQDQAFQNESSKLIKYFLAALTIPEDEMWVNLSPYEKDRIIPGGFGDTEMGRDLLAQDYLLKQLTASLMYPDEKLGNDFWKRVYQKAQEKYGTSEVPINTFNKVRPGLLNFDDIQLFASFINTRMVMDVPSFEVRQNIVKLKIMMMHRMIEAFYENSGNSLLDERHALQTVRLLESFLDYEEQIVSPDFYFNSNLPFEEGELLSRMVRYQARWVLALFAENQKFDNSISQLSKTILERNQTLFGVKVPSYGEGEPLVSVYNMWTKSESSYRGYKVNFQRLQEAKVEESHSIPLPLAKAVEEIRKMPEELISAMRESGEAHQIPFEVLAGNLLEVSVETQINSPRDLKDNLQNYSMRNLNSKSGRLAAMVNGITPRHLFSVPPRWGDFLGGVVFPEGYAGIGIFQIRNSQVRNKQLWQDVGDINISELSDREISWELLDYGKNVEAWAALLERSINEVEGFRNGELDLPLHLVEYANEATYTWAPNSPKRPDWKGFNPISQDFFGELPSKDRLGENAWMLARFHPLYGDKAPTEMINMYTVIISGVADQKPAIFTEIESDEDLLQLENILNGDDIYLRNAALATMKDLVRNSTFQNLRKGAQNILSKFEQVSSSPVELRKSLNNDETIFTEEVGGIDFNPNMMEIESKGRSEDFIFEFDNQRNVTTNIKGLVPIIINVTPVTNVPLLLGEMKSGESQQLSHF